MFARYFTIVVLAVALNALPTRCFGQADVAMKPAEHEDRLAELGFQRRVITVHGAELSYVVRKGTGPTLVLVPGSFDRAESYLGVVARLDSKLRILIVELRGHGRSRPPPTAETVTIEQFAADVFAVADEARLDSFFVGGHSIGGMTAIECARRQPHRLKGVISIEGWTRASVLQEAFNGRTDNTLSNEQKADRARQRSSTISRWTPEAGCHLRSHLGEVGRHGDSPSNQGAGA